MRRHRRFERATRVYHRLNWLTSLGFVLAFVSGIGLVVVGLIVGENTESASWLLITIQMALGVGLMAGITSTFVCAGLANLALVRAQLRLRRSGFRDWFAVAYNAVIGLLVLAAVVLVLYFFISSALLTAEQQEFQTEEGLSGRSIVH